MVVDLAIKNDNGVAILGYDGLIPAVNVDNLQARRAERDGLGLKDSLLVRTAVD